MAGQSTDSLFPRYRDKCQLRLGTPETESYISSSSLRPRRSFDYKSNKLCPNPISNDIQRYPTISNDIQRYSTIFNDAEVGALPLRKSTHFLQLIFSLIISPVAFTLFFLSFFLPIYDTYVLSVHTYVYRRKPNLSNRYSPLRRRVKFNAVANRVVFEYRRIVRSLLELLRTSRVAR